LLARQTIFNNMHDPLPDIHPCPHNEIVASSFQYFDKIRVSENRGSHSFLGKVTPVIKPSRIPKSFWLGQSAIKNEFASVVKKACFRICQRGKQDFPFYVRKRALISNPDCGCIYNICHFFIFHFRLRSYKPLDRHLFSVVVGEYSQPEMIKSQELKSTKKEKYKHAQRHKESSFTSFSKNAKAG
jgi:hypothetical protein